MKRLLWACVLIAGAFPAVGFSQDVFINGVEVQGLRNVELPGVTVVVDGEGNYHINAPQFEVQTLAPPLASVSDGENEGLQYGTWWLASADQGSAHQDVEILVRGRSVATVRSGEPPVILDISAFLVRGNNVITFRSAENSEPSNGTLAIYIGEGSVIAGELTLRQPELEFFRRPGNTLSATIHQEVLQIP